MPSNVISFNKKKMQVVEEKRRSFERVLFQNTVDCYAVIDGAESIYPLQMLDISEAGCLFQVPVCKNLHKFFKVKKNIDLRIYFTEGSYIPASVLIIREQLAKDIQGHEMAEFGCTFDQSKTSYQVLESFIKFINNFAKYSSIDHKTNKVYFL